MRDDERERQAELIMDAIERSGKPRKAVAADMGVGYTTLDGWLRGDRRMAITQLGAFLRALGSDPWLANQVLRCARLVAVPLVPEERQGMSVPIGERLTTLMLRFATTHGSLAGCVADATHPESDGGQTVTPMEAECIDAELSEIIGLATQMRDQLRREQGIEEVH